MPKKSIALAALEETLSEVIGRKIEITVRSERKFTISTERVDLLLERKVMRFFGKDAKLCGETQHDDECGSFVYIEV